MAISTPNTPFTPAPHRLRVEIHGAVQGVGFRPFVYRLATGLGLAGWVINDAAGVFIEVEGPDETLRRFLDRLPAEAPPRAIIQQLASAWLPPSGFTRFEIRHSAQGGAKTVLMLPDIATCPACLAEVLDPTDRRHRYPFTNCTNCGPRFSIIQALPYDRPNTTMRRFVMCPACQAEYESPLDRRFHAQPNACPVCGPRLAFYARAAAADAWQATTGDPITQTVAALRAGQIVAVKGLGGFHLLADATHETAVAALRRRKRRGDKPFAVMVRDGAMARAVCTVTTEAEALLGSAEAPIVLLPKAAPAEAQFDLAPAIAPANPYLGVMLPYTPLHHLLLAALGVPVVATSGNVTDEPICIANDEAFDRLGDPLPDAETGLADAFLAHDRPIERHVDDSVAWMLAGAPRLLRRARGFAPLPVLLAQPAPAILAVGAHLKNTVALSVGRQVFISQHIGDLETPQALAAFERVIADFSRIYEAEPIALAHDLHPDYLSTQWAREASGLRLGDHGSPARLIAVQHHHAHLAACLAENQIDGPALGVTWDGTGLGTDGTIWGGEFLLGDAAGYTRVAHLRPFRLPGGDAAVREPRRVALALLWELYGEAAFEMTDLPPVAAFTPHERQTLRQMLGRGINAARTTSAGRLFDGIAALVGLHGTVTFEGQAAMALEFIAEPGERGAYEIRLAGPARPDDPIVLDWAPLLEAALADLRRGVERPIIAARTHNGLVAGILGVARASGQERVALTGGCFQNRLLTEGATAELTQRGFTPVLHRQVPPNDGGISLGQIAVAQRRLALD